MLKKYLKQFIDCHEGVINRFVHLIGFSIVGLGIIYKNPWLVVLGGFFQEFGHIYQYAKTRKKKDSPLYCLKPQSIFAFPLFFAILFYTIFA